MSLSELLEQPDVQAVLASPEQLVWARLTPDMQRRFVNERNWRVRGGVAVPFFLMETQRAVIKWSLTNQLRWKTNLVRQVVVDEKAYYQEVLRSSMEALMLYPYHLSDVVMQGLQVSPFSYYRDMLLSLMRKDESYDMLQNFTAADVHRLLGIGRNEYINIMNSSRSNRAFALFKKKENQLESLVPSQAVEIPLKPWWLVHLGYVSEEDVRQLSKLEHATVDMLLDCGPTQAGKIDRAVVSSLHTRGLVWLDIPVAASDVLGVTSLENFVMNRTAKSDYMEKLLYKMFVTIDERSTVAQLAEVLRVEEELVRNAMSVFLRLGFAEKKNPEEVQGAHPSWAEYAALHGDEQVAAKTAATALLAGNSGAMRIGFLFDAALTAFLMMGNLAEGLKQHAVMLYEVGKLADEQLDSFLQHLGDVHVMGDEGEAKRYFEHAITLKQTLQTLRKNPELQIEGCDGQLDMLRCESLGTLDRDARARVLKKNYAVLFSMCPMSREPPIAPSDGIAHFGPACWEVTSPWWKLFLNSLLGAERAPPTKLYCKGERVLRLPGSFAKYPFVRITKWDNESLVVPRGAALLLINDLTLAFPVLAQPYPSHDPQVLHAAFPLRLCDPDATAAGSEWTEATAERHPDVQLLARELKLQTDCGFVELVHMGEGEGWVVFDVLYGLPLFADKVAMDVLRNITRDRLLSPENIETHKANSVALAERLRQFVGSGDKPSSDLPLPLFKSS